MHARARDMKEAAVIMYFDELAAVSQSIYELFYIIRLVNTTPFHNNLIIESCGL